MSYWNEEEIRLSGFRRGELEIIASPTGRMQSRLMVNLPSHKEVVGVTLPDADLSNLESRVEALATKSISALMQSADHVIGIERSVATPGQTFQLFNSRTGKETTYEFKDTGDWEETH